MKSSFFDLQSYRGVLLALLLLVLSPLAAQAQLTRGTISGTVRDDSGAVIAGAKVTITNAATNQTRETTSDERGFFRVPALEPGSYSVRFEKSGFKITENTGIKLDTASEVTVDSSLPVATAGGDVVVVEGSEAILLNKSNATVGLTLSNKQAVELPLSAGRDVNNLALLSPNVFAAPGSSGISSNGQRARNNNFTIDGSDNNDVSVTIPTSPIAPEAVAEFQIQTNAFSAEFGRNSGAQINVITKSGSNEFHGQAFEYYRGSALNSLDNIEKGAGLSRPGRFNRNQFGADLGGRIIRDRTFFYGFFQGDRTRTGAVPGALVRIPTPTGFAALSSVPLRAASGSLPAQSAASRQAVLDRLAFLRDVYALNPAFRSISPVTVNGRAIETGLTNIGISQPANTWNFITRIDHQFSDRDSLTARYTYNKPVSVNVVSNTGFGSRFAGNQNVLAQNLAASETHIFNPSMLNEFRFSYVRRNLQFPENDPDSPTAAIGGFFTIGGAANFPQGRVQNSFQFSDTFSKQFGRHAIKAGLDIRYLQLDNTAAFDTKGTFNFASLQDFLNNNAATFQQALQTASFDARQTQQYYFAQDEFRISPELTLSFGLRYERNSVPFGFFGATDAQSLAAGVPGPTEADNNNFAPTVGVAYSPRANKGLLGTVLGEGKTVFRGGYRVNYDVLFFNILTVNASNFPRVVVGLQPNALDVYPNRAQVTGSPVFSPLATYVNTPTDAQNPRSEIYSFSIQREFAKDFVLEVGYTGSRSRNGINQLQANPGVLTDAQAAQVRQTGNPLSIPSLQARRVNPALGSRVLISTSARALYNAGYINLQKRFARGLQFGVAYTFSKFMSDNDESLGVGAITTFSPQIPQDFNNLAAERSVSAFDRTHRVAANFIYEIPWFKSAWASNVIVKNIFSGWQIAGTIQAQSGQPFTILTGLDTNGNGAGGDRPNVNPGGVFTRDPETGDLRSFTTNRTTGLYVVPVGANGLPLNFSLGNGNLGRNTLRGPGFRNVDASLMKRVKFLERQEVQLRVDAFNLFNQDSYGNPVNTMNSPDFGRNLNNWGNRSLTLSARYRF